MRIWIVFRLHKWEDLEMEQCGEWKLPVGIKMNAPSSGEIGFLSVFDDYELALKDSGNNPDLIREVRSGDETVYIPI